MSVAMYNTWHTPAMPLDDAHFGGFFVVTARIVLESMGVARTRIARIIHPNNTPQAYPAVRCGDAQTGGLLISGAANAI